MSRIVESERRVTPLHQRFQEGVRSFFDGEKSGYSSFSMNPEAHGNVHVSFGLACGIAGYFPDRIEVKWEPRDPDIFSVKMIGRLGGSVILQSCGESVGVFRTGYAVSSRSASVDVLVGLCLGVMQREMEARKEKSVVQ